LQKMGAGSVRYMIGRPRQFFLFWILAGSLGAFPFVAPAQTVDPEPHSITIETNVQGTLVFSSSRKPDENKLILWILSGRELRSSAIAGVNPVLTSDGKFIIFKRGDEIRQADIRSKRDEILGVSKISGVYAFDLAPNGQKVCFNTVRISADGLNGFNLHIINLDGSDLRCLTGFPSDDINGINNPKWSPDGNNILFTAFDPSEQKGQRNVHLWTIRQDGTALKKITGEISKYSVNEPAWSPDGKQIVFVARSEPARPEDYELYICNVDGSNVRQLTDNDWNEREPVFSPDGKQICFVSYRHQKVGMAGYGSELFLINIDGTGEKRLTPPQKLSHALGGWSEDHSPTWAPRSAPL